MLEPLFGWMQESWLSGVFLDNTWASPIVQCLHLLALIVFSGSILLVDIRLLGRGLTKIPTAKLARDVQPWLIWSFLSLVVTGIPMVVSTAYKQYYSPFFWRKMILLGIGLVFTFTLRRWVAHDTSGRFGRIWPKLVAIVSIGIWTMVAIWARLIGLLS